MTWRRPMDHRDPAARREIFPGYFRIHVDQALTQGVVHTTPGRTAAALWLPAGSARQLPTRNTWSGWPLR